MEIIIFLVIIVVILFAIKGKVVGLKEETTTLSTKLSIEAVGATLHEICNEWKTAPESIVSNSGALSQFDNRAEIEILISNKAGMFSSRVYAVQVYVSDLGNKREILLVALGNSGFSRILYGPNVEMVKMSESIKRRDMIAERIMRYSAQ